LFQTLIDRVAGARLHIDFRSRHFGFSCSVRLIHKDIKPANILVDAASGGVWLTGFGIASRLPRERQPRRRPR
jgi:serine/threonine protein kinase